MKLISLKILLLLVLVYSTAVGATCKLDYEKVNAIAANAVIAQKKGNFIEAKGYFKKAARKLSGMKYRCNDISLKEMTGKERQYRLLANYTDCGSLLKNAQAMVIKSQQPRLGRKQQSLYKDNALAFYNTVLERCPNSQYDKYATKKIQLLENKRAYVKSKPKPKLKTSARTNIKPESLVRKYLPRKNRVRIGSCFYRHLRPAIALENKGNKAFYRKKYSDAVVFYKVAADQYISKSQQCKKAKERVAALDKAKTLRSKMIKIKTDYLGCERKISGVRGVRDRAYIDEQASEFDLAQEGYKEAYTSYLALPKACSAGKFRREMQSSQNKSRLLACPQYIVGIKSYNLAFNAMSKAKRKVAAKFYRKAAKSFGVALARCGFKGENFKMLNKLQTVSSLKANR